MTDTIRGMVLAAGYGTRLAPVTDHVPKPLLSVGGKTLLERAICALAEAGCEAVAVNTHHLGTMIADYLEAVTLPVPVSIFPETEILGTGGALDGARDFLAQADHFLVHNGDVLWDGDLAVLVKRHLRSPALATLLLHDWPAVNTVVMGDDGAVLSFGKEPASSGRHLTYTGLGVFDRRLLADIGPGFSSLIDPLERALITDPGSVRAVVQPGVQWSDLGTLGRYLGALGDQAETTGPLGVEPLTGHGSDRRFWRLKAGPWSAVAMLDVPDSQEFERQVAITNALHTAGLGTAEILATDAPNHALLMEDLGKRDLWSAVVTLPPEMEAWRALYGPVVDKLLHLQACDLSHLAKVPSLRDRTLGYDDLRWETNYFQERFLQGYCHFSPGDLRGLSTEFDTLAHAVASQPQVVIHRDFQSRNIMLTPEGVRLVDVQGMRQGPLLYDLASLLYDPYVMLPSGARDNLLDRFVAGVTDPELTRTDLEAMFLAAALQRLMQALGAFGFLGLVKGKTEFLAHIPRALNHLRQVLAAVPKVLPKSERWLPVALPSLTTLVDKALEKCGPEVTDE